MKKMPTIFERDWDDPKHPITRTVNPDAAWVFEGYHSWTRKYDGTCVMFDGESWWARREVKKGKSAPPRFLPMDEDATTGKVMGWEPIEQSGWVKFWEEARTHEDPERGVIAWGPGTYELCGPKINGNPEGYEHHVLVLHAAAESFAMTNPITYDSLREALERYAPIEGFVVHGMGPHAGKMAKIKRKDYPA